MLTIAARKMDNIKYFIVYISRLIANNLRFEFYTN
mgnify:CR=1 FL=1